MASTQHQKRLPAWARWGRDILLVIGVVLLVQWWQSKDMPKGDAPPLAGLLLTGGPVSIESLRGRPVLVHFWAEWCPICRLEESSIDAIADDHQVLSVATTSGSRGEVAAYLQKQGLSMPVIVDESGDLARQWSVAGVPATFIVDSSGQIAYATVGYSSEWGLRLRLWLAD